MARKVKCLYCGQFGSSDEFFKLQKEGGGKRFSYFCSEGDYNKWLVDQEEKEVYKALIEYVSEHLFEYEKGMVFPTSLTRRIKKLREFYSYDIIKAAFEESSEPVKWALGNKEFYNEYGKTSYIMAIVESKINDAYLEMKMKERQEERVINKKSNVDIEMLNESKTINIVRSSKKKDISEFLDD